MSVRSRYRMSVLGRPVIACLGVVRAQNVRFKVASVKPIPANAEVAYRPQPADGAAYDVTPKALIGFAYTLEDFRIRGVPWC